MIVQIEANIEKEIAFLTLTTIFNQGHNCEFLKWNPLWEWKAVWLWKLLLGLELWGGEVILLHILDVLKSSGFSVYLWGCEVAKGTVFKFLSPGDKEVKEWKVGAGGGEWAWSKWCKQPENNCFQYQWILHIHNVRGAHFPWRDQCRRTGTSIILDIFHIIDLRRGNLKGWEH